jgi:hypothetical protein
MQLYPQGKRVLKAFNLIMEEKERIRHVKKEIMQPIDEHEQSNPLDQRKALQDLLISSNHPSINKFTQVFNQMQQFQQAKNILQWLPQTNINQSNASLNPAMIMNLIQNFNNQKGQAGRQDSSSPLSPRILQDLLKLQDGAPLQDLIAKAQTLLKGSG